MKILKILKIKRIIPNFLTFDCLLGPTEIENSALLSCISKNIAMISIFVVCSIDLSLFFPGSYSSASVVISIIECSIGRLES